MDYYKAFPFYMGYRDTPYASTPYQGYGQWNQAPAGQPMMLPEDRILEDMEYLQQMYPTYAKNYQNVISSVADKLSIQRMVSSVMTVIKTNEDKENGSVDSQQNQTMNENMLVTADTLTERAPWGEKEPWIRELVTVLMYYEILGRRKRRQKKYWNMSI